MELANFELYFNKSDLEELLPFLQRALDGMAAANDDGGETIVGCNKHAIDITKFPKTP